MSNSEFKFLGYESFVIVISFCILMLIVSVLVNIFSSKAQTEKKEQMAQTGLLVVSNFAKISSVLASAKKHVNKTLYISFASPSRLAILSYSEQITGIYRESIQLCSNLDVRVLVENLKNPLLKEIRTISPIDLVIFDQKPQAFEPNEFARSHILNLKDTFSVLNIGEHNEASKLMTNVGQQPNEDIYDYVALGGTFDRLHTGHKILLSQGILRAKKHLTVGVTDVNMIKSKKLWELIEPIDVRIKHLKQFLIDIDPNLEYNVVPIQDMYGPTKDDPRLELLIVSKETIKGGDKVNEKRHENKLSPMAIHCIELASEKEKSADEEEEKVSSSNTRMRLLGSVFKEPEDNPIIPLTPYIIGLTGGIASGKTKITERLGNLGAGVVNCDYLAHELYRAGQPMNATLAQTFGQDIIDVNGEVNRKKLGAIVFNDPTRLIELNNLLWPEIIKLAQERVKKLGQEGYRVVVMEAAVLIQADWQKYCHQVWTSIIPPAEAIKRLIERNGLSEQAAKERLSSQPSNSEQVAAANVVFSSLWSYDFTSSQVSKAWSNLQLFLDEKNYK